jgi:hypothetical protein
MHGGGISGLRGYGQNGGDLQHGGKQQDSKKEFFGAGRNPRPRQAAESSEQGRKQNQRLPPVRPER